MSERSLEQRLRREITKLHGLCIKFVSPGLRGVPDRIVLLPWKRLYFVELKSETGELSKLQILLHSIFVAIGWPVYVISNNAELEDFLLAVK